MFNIYFYHIIIIQNIIYVKVLSMGDFFSFEDEGLDFPFYNGEPLLSKFDYVVLLLPLILFGIYLYVDFPIDLGIYAPVVICLLFLIPIAYVCRGKLNLIFKKPKKQDLKVILICFIAYMIFSYMMVALLISLGFTFASNSADTVNNTSLLLIVLIMIQLMGEELFKVSLLLLGMSVVFHVTRNRKISLIISVIVCMILFGLSHLSTYNGNVIQCLLVIGLGTFIHLFPYLKTKNIVNSYIMHVLIDVLPMLI